jgi:DNA-binding NarL/FixJ family response regulator
LRLEALALARQHADSEALFIASYHLLLSGAPQYWAERVRLAEECVAWPRQGVSVRTLGLALWYCGLVHLAQGERARAEDLWRQLEDLAERTRVVAIAVNVAWRDAVLAIVEGRLDDGLTLIRRSIDLADESGVPTRGRQIGGLLLIAPALYLGRADILLAHFNESAGTASLAALDRPTMHIINYTAVRAICLAQLGRMEEARKLAGPLLDGVAGSDDDFPIAQLTLLLQTAVVLEHRAAAKALADRLACVAHLAGAEYFETTIGRHLGDAAVLAGDQAVARVHYMRALEAAGKIPFRPELALTHLRLAELLLDTVDDAARLEALEHLEIAVPELRDMHMQPALDRALGLLDRAESDVASRAGLGGLTAREREVAALLARGMTNRDIAGALVITEGTAEVHVKHILGKLGLKSRAQVAAWAKGRSQPPGVG